MWTHPPLLFVSYAALTLSFGSAIASFSDANSEKYSYTWAKIGYLLLTAGIVLGYPWALIAWKSEPWWWSPKINVSLMMWLFYSSYLHSRLYLHKRGFFKFTQGLNIASYSVLLFTYITTYLIPGVHTYG
jgi:cytochrome c biogenesis factor